MIYEILCRTKTASDTKIDPTKVKTRQYNLKDYDDIHSYKDR